MIAKVTDLQAKIESDEIQVKSAFDMSTEEIAAYEAAVEL